MKPCKSEGHVYFAGQLWVNNDPKLILMTLTLDADVTVGETSYSMQSRTDAGIEDLQIQSHVCDNTYWIMGIGRRAKEPKRE